MRLTLLVSWFVSLFVGRCPLPLFSTAVILFAAAAAAAAAAGVSVGLLLLAACTALLFRLLRVFFIRIPLPRVVGLFRI